MMSHTRALAVTVKGFLTRLFGSIAVTCCAIAHADPTGTILYQQRIPGVPVHLVAETSISGKLGFMIVDTGAAISGLDNSLKDSIRSKRGEADVLSADGKQYPMMTYEVPPIRIGKLSVKRSTVILSDFSAFSRFTGRPLAGVVGIGVLGHAKIFLNYDECIFQLHAGPWKLDKSDCHEVELEKTETPTFKTRILGREEAFTVDSGSDECIALEAKLFKALVNDHCIELAQFKEGGVSIGSMTSTSDSGWFLKGELMGKNLRGVSVVSNPRSSRLGLEWLYGFNTEIDFTTQKLRYQLRRNAKFPGSVQMMLGVLFQYDKRGARVESLLPGGGAAEDAGLKPNDVIEQFGAVKADEMNAATMAEAVADAAGKEVAVRFLRKSDGEHVNTKLKLPPNISEWNFSGRASPNGK